MCKIGGTKTKEKRPSRSLSALEPKRKLLRAERSGHARAGHLGGTLPSSGRVATGPEHTVADDVFGAGDVREVEAVARPRW